MKTSSFSIHIPEPCHQDWDAMQPDATGRFCGSCSKSVIDFSGKTDAEIHTILTQLKEQKVCGHFKTSQVNRPLNLRVDLRQLPRRMSGTHVFAVALFLVFGSVLFSCTNYHGQRLGEIEVVPYLSDPPETAATDTYTDVIKGDTLVTETPNTESACTWHHPIENGLMTGEINIIAPPDTTFAEPQVMGLIRTTLPEEDIKNILSEDSVSPSVFIDPNEKPTSDLTLSSSGLLLYPNPGSGEFTLRYQLERRCDVQVMIMEQSGRLVSMPVNIPAQHAGIYNISVNISDQPNGVYIVTLVKNDARLTQKLILEK